MRNARNTGIFIVKYYSCCVFKNVWEIKTENVWATVLGSSGKFLCVCVSARVRIHQYICVYVGIEYRIGLWVSFLIAPHIFFF